METSDIIIALTLELVLKKIHSSRAVILSKEVRSLRELKYRARAA